jgi:hypothetical protein
MNQGQKSSIVLWQLHTTNPFRRPIDNEAHQTALMVQTFYQ